MEVCSTDLPNFNKNSCNMDTNNLKIALQKYIALTSDFIVQALVLRDISFYPFSDIW